MTRQPATPPAPRTAAGRRLLAESENNTVGEGERELFLEDILAIEAEAAAGSGSLDVREALRFLGPDPILADGSLWTIDELVEKVTAALAATSASDQEAEE